MLMAVKNQCKVTYLSFKFALMREMLNKTTFFTNVFFMILNNASFIIQWIILYSLKEDVGGYTFSQVLLLWGIAASTYGVAHLFFEKAFSLSDIIHSGKLDAFLVQPKNVLISVITSDIKTSAIGDILYGFIMMWLSGFTVFKLCFFVFFSISGGIFLVSISVILSSLSFWFQKSEFVADTGNGLMVNFATYPDGIFKGIAKVLLFTIIPVGFVNYLPVHMISEFQILWFLIILFVTGFVIFLAFFLFYKGLNRYTSSSLMSARI